LLWSASTTLAEAVFQRLPDDATPAEWIFHQEKATLHEAGNATQTGEPLSSYR